MKNDKDEKPYPDEKPINKTVFPFVDSAQNDLPWSTFLGRKEFSPGVMVYSYYFKQLGMPQTLHNGDWYFVNSGDDKNPNYNAGLYTKNPMQGDLTFEELDFMSSGKYVRIPSIQEFMLIIAMCTYNFSFEGGFEVDIESDEIVLRVESRALNNALTVRGRDLHATLANAAYLVYLIARNVNGFMLEASSSLVSPIGGDEDNDA